MTKASITVTGAWNNRDFKDTKITDKEEAQAFVSTAKPDSSFKMQCRDKTYLLTVGWNSTYSIFNSDDLLPRTGCHEISQESIVDRLNDLMAGSVE